MGLGPIPASKIRKYAKNQLGICDEDDSARVFSIIRQMDDEYLTLNNASSKDKPLNEVSIDDAAGVTALFEKRSKNPGPKKSKKT